MVRYNVYFNGEQVKTYELEEPVIFIGRLPENQIPISNMGISRRHVKIELDPHGAYTLTDLNSLNGTLVNGKKVKKATLATGDKITIGKYTIVYEDLRGDVVSHLETIVAEFRPEDLQRMAQAAGLPMPAQKTPLSPARQMPVPQAMQQFHAPPPQQAMPASQMMLPPQMVPPPQMMPPPQVMPSPQVMPQQVMPQQVMPSPQMPPPQVMPSPLMMPPQMMPSSQMPPPQVMPPQIIPSSQMMPPPQMPPPQVTPSPLTMPPPQMPPPQVTPSPLTMPSPQMMPFQAPGVPAAELPPVAPIDEESFPGAVLIETTSHVVYRLDRDYFTIGSDEGDDIYADKASATVERRDGGFYITAQKSKVKINGKNAKAQRLEHRDRIEVGSNTFRFMENGQQ